MVGDDGVGDQATEARLRRRLGASEGVGVDGDELHELGEASGGGRTPARWRGGGSGGRGDAERDHATAATLR